MLHYDWCTDQTLAEATALSLLLWPGTELAMRQDELQKFLHEGNGAIALCYEGNLAVAFAQVSLRHDYVEGTDGGPVGYLEGIYVREPYRRAGIARALTAMAEQWAATQGCTQMASDCELENEMSRRFHLGSGFAEANRIICFVKKIESEHEC